MPGIVGIIGGRDSERNLHLLQKMVNSLIHDPDYRSGIVQFEKLGLWIGWACHAGSFSDCMPVWNETRDVIVVSHRNETLRRALDFLRSGQVLWTW